MTRETTSPLLRSMTRPPHFAELSIGRPNELVPSKLHFSAWDRIVRHGLGDLPDHIDQAFVGLGKRATCDICRSATGARQELRLLRMGERVELVRRATEHDARAEAVDQGQGDQTTEALTMLRFNDHMADHPRPWIEHDACHLATRSIRAERPRS